MNAPHCTCYVLPHAEDCGALVGITQDGERVYAESEATESAPAAAPIAAPIDTAEKRLQAWAGVCAGGSINLARAGDVLYTWDPHPRRLKNGALEGRVYAQRRGEVFRDADGFKIAGDGTVAKVPAALRAILPGAAEASAEDQPEPMNGDDHG